MILARPQCTAQTHKPTQSPNYAAAHLSLTTKTTTKDPMQNADYDNNAFEPSALPVPLPLSCTCITKTRESTTLLRNLRTDRAATANGVADEVGVCDLRSDTVTRGVWVLGELSLQHRRC